MVTALRADAHEEQQDQVQPGTGGSVERPSPTVMFPVRQPAVGLNPACGFRPSCCVGYGRAAPSIEQPQVHLTCLSRLLITNSCIIAS
jgi:hypothetical protein